MRVWLSLWAILWWSAGYADVTLPSVFSDHMVLQRDREDPIWGTASPGEKIAVELGTHKVSATADEHGDWKASLPRLSAGGPFELHVSGTNTLVIHDVLVGEVWLCGGQSNMQYPVRTALNASAEIAAANHPMIRLFNVPRVVSVTPQRDVKCRWTPCTPETVPEFTALGYFFGRDLQPTLGVPVGLIHSSWGGTPIEAWIRHETLAADPEYASLLDFWKGTMQRYAAAQRRVAEWRKNPTGTRPRPPSRAVLPHQPSVLYNAMYAPLIPYGIRGMIFYHGGTNVGRAHQYRKLFRLFISDTRRLWGEGDFPFLYCQLANNGPKLAVPAESASAELREAQLMALAVPNTAMSCAIDIGEASNVHFANKQELGRRVALAARALAYGERLEYSGPLYRGMKIEGDQLRLEFSHDEGLTLKPGKSFAIAGEDHKFVWADAKVDGRSVVVSSRKVPHPVAVHYARADNPDSILYNAAGLPASPFRTDDWPGETDKATTPLPFRFQ